MKNTNYKFLSVLFFSVVFFSCEKENEGLNDSVKAVNSGSAKVVPVSPFLVTNAVNTFNEGGSDKELEFTVVLDVPQPTETFVTVKALSTGSATEDDDFTYDKVVQIAPFAKSGKGKITILGDAIAEGNETFTLKIGDNNDANIVVDQMLSFKITDFGDLDLTFSWDMEIPGFAPVTLCQLGYDVDMYIYDSANADVTSFSGATTDCPETITLSVADLEDGIYTIRANFYADGGLAGAGVTPAFNIPIKMDYSRNNSPFAGTIVQDNVDVINSDFGNTPGFDTQFKYVATIKVENGLFTFSKNGGANIATGRVSNSYPSNPNKPRKSI